MKTLATRQNQICKLLSNNTSYAIEERLLPAALKDWLIHCQKTTAGVVL